ncbi:MAG: hypothetical protein ABIZ91_20530 [Gemmatimonadaceae bacterium]
MDEYRERSNAEASPQPSRRAPHCPSLSVVLLSTGDRTSLERALEAIAGGCRRLEAEIVVVRSRMLEDAAMLRAAYPCVLFIDAQHDASSLEMRDIGARNVSGDIITFRMDVAVGDGSWLGAFESTVGSVSESLPLEIEVPLLAVAGDLPPEFARKSRDYLAPNLTATSKRRIEAIPRLLPLVATREMERATRPLSHEL